MLNIRKIYTRFFSIMLIMLTLTACDMKLNEFGMKPVLLDTEVNYGPPEFRAAYNDGCESAISATGFNITKTRYGLKKSPEYEQNRMYHQVWKDAYAFCYMWYYIYKREENIF